MKPVSAFEFFRLTRFSKPIEDRAIYKTVRQEKVRSILEVGLGSGSRSETLIRVANQYSVCGGVRYTGIDQFEGRDEGQPTLSLRVMHKKLSAFEAKVQLVPGDLYPSLTRIANTHVRTDLILISAGYDQQQLAPCWFYFPRMLHAGSKFMIQREQDGIYQVLTRLEIERLAEENGVNRTSRAA